MLVLYHDEMSTSSQKVRICLAEKSLDWESKPVSLRAGEQQQDWYVMLNPRAVVPTLVDDGRIVTESTVINEYLEQKYPSPGLMPPDAFGRGQVRLWTKQIDESIHDAGITVLVYGIALRQLLVAQGDEGLRKIAQMPDLLKRERRRDLVLNGIRSVHFRIGLSRMEQMLDDMNTALAAGPWLCGADYTLADVSFLPYIIRLDQLALTAMIERRRSVAAWLERCKERPSYQEGVARWLKPGPVENLRTAGRAHWAEIEPMLA
jgi:glutathione S-transferase